MRNLFTEPLWKAEDLGKPIPDVRHACSVCIPTWEHVIDYEEGRDKVTRALQSGYPRFVLHPDVSALFAKVRGEYANADQDVMVYPSREAAQRAQRFLELQNAKALEIMFFKGVFVLVFPKDAYNQAKLFWRYTGEGVSSRLAQRILAGREAEEAVADVRSEFAKFYGGAEEDMHLWQSGMSAIYAAHRYTRNERPTKKSLQVEFPYVCLLYTSDAADD